MQTVTVSDKAAAFIEECRDFHTANTIKAGIADVFAFALSESTAIKLDPDAIVGLETLSRLADMVNEFARNDIAE